MIIELLIKDFGLYRSQGKKGDFWIGLAMRIIVAIGAISVISYMTYWMDTLIKQHSEYFGFNTMVFFLTMACAIQIFDGVGMARSVMFDFNDHAAMSPLILPKDLIVISKMLFVYIFQIIDGLILSTPMLVMFGVSRGFIPYYYIFSAIYPLFLALISTGIIFVIVVPTQLVHKALNEKELIKFFIAGIFILGVTYLYKLGYDTFLKMLEGYGYDGIFSEGFINAMFNMGPYLAPFYQLFTAVCRQQQILSGISLFLGVCLLSSMIGFSVSYLFYENLGRRNMKTNVPKNLDKVKKPTSKTKTMIGKELKQILKKEDNLFSYSTLLVVLPLLSYCVLSAIDEILIKNLRLAMDHAPDLGTITQLLVLFTFLAIIQMQTIQPYSSEGENLKNIKLLPLSDKKITLIKIMVPFCLTGLSFLTSMIVCYCVGLFSLSSFLLILACGFLYLLFIGFGGVMTDMADLRGDKHSAWTSFYTITCLYSLILTALNIAFEFSSVRGVYLLTFDVCLTGVLAISMIVLYFVKGSEYFRKMEVSV